MYQVIRGGVGKHVEDSDPKNYHYLNMSECYDVPGMDDAEDFREVSKALLSVGYVEKEVDDMWDFVASMLMLGNIDFGDGDDAIVQDRKPLEKASELLSCGDFNELLIKKAITIGGEVTMKNQSPANARLARDSAVKIMYARLFTYLVVRINTTIDRGAKTRSYIGLLDVYGFEFFYTNSFEQALHESARRVRVVSGCPEQLRISSGVIPEEDSVPPGDPCA